MKVLHPPTCRSRLFHCQEHGTEAEIRMQNVRTHSCHTTRGDTIDTVAHKKPKPTSPRAFVAFRDPPWCSTHAMQHRQQNQPVHVEMAVLSVVFTRVPMMAHTLLSPSTPARPCVW